MLTEYFVHIINVVQRSWFMIIVMNIRIVLDFQIEITLKWLGKRGLLIAIRFKCNTWLLTYMTGKKSYSFEYLDNLLSYQNERGRFFASADLSRDDVCQFKLECIFSLFRIWKLNFIAIYFDWRLANEEQTFGRNDFVMLMKSMAFVK